MIAEIVQTFICNEFIKISINEWSYALIPMDTMKTPGNAVETSLETKEENGRAHYSNLPQ